jgi:hypothetical protein
VDTTPDKNTFSLGLDSPLFLKGVIKVKRKGKKKFDRLVIYTLLVNIKPSEDLSTGSYGS